MIKYYKFKMNGLFQDETEDTEAYYPQGIISLINYDQLMYQNKISAMWKSPMGIAYESMLNMSDVELIECTAKEYKHLSDDIDFISNNNIQKLLNEGLFDKPEKKPILMVVKTDNK